MNTHTHEGRQMSDLASLIKGVNAQSLKSVALDITGTDPAGVRIDSVRELSRHHNDQRTVGLFRIEGESDENNWSCVVKVVDLAMPPNDGVGWNHPEIEESIYRENLLYSLPPAFRPARCYGVVELTAKLHSFWMEDLTPAPQPPWTIDQYRTSAHHLGQFDGYQSVRETQLRSMEIPAHNYVNRWLNLSFDQDVGAITSGRVGKSVSRALGPSDVSTLKQVVASIPRFLEKSKRLPPYLTHGDSHARNMFPLGDETVAIDWAGLAREPLGTGVGALIGSGLTWSLDEQEMVLDGLESVYASYVDGLRAGGWNGRNQDVRLGMFCQLGAYLMIIGTFPVSLDTLGIEDRRKHYEARIGVALEDAPALIAAVMPRLTGYLDEFVELSN